MTSMPERDVNVYKLLDFIGNSSRDEIVGFGEKLNEDERKIYDVCITRFNELNEKYRPQQLHSFLASIHEKTSNYENSETIGHEYFRGRQVKKDVLNFVSNIERVALDSGGFTEAIIRKLENQKEKKIEGNFAAFFAEIKESEGVDDYMHRIFLTTNEGQHTLVQNQLKHEPLLGNAVLDGHGGNTLMAVSGFCGLNLLSVRGEGIDTLIVLDRSRRVEAFWSAMNNIICTSDTRHEVIHKLEQLVTTDIFKVGLPPDIHYDPLGDLRKEILAGDSWLSSTRRFKAVKQIFDSKRFVFKRVDVTDFEAMQSLKAALQKSQSKIDTFYVSNITEYLKPNEVEQFKKGVLEVLEDKMLVVDTVPRQTTEEPLNQRVVKLSKESVDESFCSSNVCIVPRV